MTNVTITLECGNLSQGSNVHCAMWCDEITDCDNGGGWRSFPSSAQKYCSQVEAKPGMGKTRDW